MRKSDSLGSVGPLAIALIVLAAIIIIGAVVLLLSGGDDEATNGGEVLSGEPADDSSSAANGDSSDGQASGPAATPSSGDYTIASVQELLPVCDANSFPSGVVATSSGNITVPFLQEESGGGYRYLSSLASMVSDLAPDSTRSNMVDRVACISPTETEAFRLPCTISGTDFDLVGLELDVVVYDIHSKQQVATFKLTHSRECPVFATLRDGVYDAVNIDAESLESSLSNL